MACLPLGCIDPPLPEAQLADADVEHVLRRAIRGVAPRAKLRARVIPHLEAQAETRGSAAADTPSPTAALTPQTGTVLDVLPRRRRRRPKRHGYRTDQASQRF